MFVLYLSFYIIAYTTLNKFLAVFINNICGFVKEYSLVWYALNDREYERNEF